MDHEGAKELFTEYRDGTLAADQVSAVKQHLATCDACREEYEAFASAVSGLVRLKAEAPPDFLSSVQGQIRRRSRGRFFGPRSRWSRFPLELVSLITLMIMLIAYLFLSILEPTKVKEGGTGTPNPPALGE